MKPSDSLEKIRTHKHSNYVHQEYPKWITRKDGSRMIVEDEYHHADIQAEDAKAENVLAEQSSTKEDAVKKIAPKNSLSSKTGTK